MEIFKIAVLLGLAVVVYFVYAQKKGSAAITLLNRRLQRENEKAGRFVTFLDKHIPTFEANRRQLTRIDDYGVLVEKDWQRELDYFIQKVLPTEFKSTGTVSYRAYIANALRSKSDARDHQKRMDIGSTERQTPSYQPGMSGIEFEQLVESILFDYGCSVLTTAKTGDQGGDLIAHYRGIKVVIQCKRSATTIGNSAVQQVIGARHYYAAEKA